LEEGREVLVLWVGDVMIKLKALARRRHSGFGGLA
jgi:hypothetical protein